VVFDQWLGPAVFAGHKADFLTVHCSVDFPFPVPREQIAPHFQDVPFGGGLLEERESGCQGTLGALQGALPTIPGSVPRMPGIVKLNLTPAFGRSLSPAPAMPVRRLGLMREVAAACPSPLWTPPSAARSEGEESCRRFARFLLARSRRKNPTLHQTLVPAPIKGASCAVNPPRSLW